MQVAERAWLYMKKAEILAPAGSMESLRAAINASCDAVYVGGTKFGARAYADNFTEETMAEAIDLVHLHQKKIYLTVNTLLKSSELEKELFEYIKGYYEHGVDAVIVQDLGVLHFLHANFPDLSLHASTQMSVTMGKGAGVLKKMGVTRIVNARELSLKEIRSIKEDTDIEVESFVHGALCYCYSGKCLLSSVIGGRSGNRGRCAQPCRMPYQLQIDGKTEGSGYYLSPKDIETLHILPKLIEAGIDSFKIEGRMKGPEYTAAVTAAYVKYRDMYYNLGKDAYENYSKKHPEALQEDIRKLSDIYNRGGFSTGYYEKHNGYSMLTTNRPNHTGVSVGKVIKKTDSQMVIQLTEDINAQDILEIRNEKEALYEFTVKSGEKKNGTVTANYKRGLKIQAENQVYRTRNNSLLAGVREEYLEKGTRLPIQGHFTAGEDKPICLTLDCYDKQISVRGEVPGLAQNQPASEEKLYKQIDKLGDTPFYFKELIIDLKGELFIPVGKLNELRRQGIEQLVKTITESHRRDEVQQKYPVSFIGVKEKQSVSVSVLVQTKEQLKAVWDCEEVSEIIVESDTLPLTQLLSITKGITDRGKRAVLALPHVLREKGYELLLQNKSLLEDNTIDGFLIRNLEEYALITEILSSTKRIIGDFYLYAMNRSGAQCLKELGIGEITAPYELNFQELKENHDLYHYMTVYTKLPVMVSAQCLYLTQSQKDKGSANVSEEACCFRGAKNAVLIDRFQNGFPVSRHCRDCYNVIYNSKPMSLLSCSEEVMMLKPSSIRLDFIDESEKETAEILEKFLDVYLHGIQHKEDSQDYTKGHFKRGIE